MVGLLSIVRHNQFRLAINIKKMMMIKLKLTITLLFLVSLGLNATAKPKFSIEPLGSTEVNLTRHGVSQVFYQVTNNTKITRTLTFVPSNGIIHNSLVGCPFPFTLSQGSSCILNLIISDENIVTDSAEKDPIICKTNSSSDNSPNLFLCSQASNTNRLNISLSELETGKLSCWGQNEFGEVGVNTGGIRVNPAEPVQRLSDNIRQVTNGLSHTCALTGEGGVKCWGSNSEGQLGVNKPDETSEPRNVNGLQSGVVAITAGDVHNCALLEDGQVKCWGGNGFGQLGRGNRGGMDDRPDFTAPLSAKAIKIRASSLGSCALLINGDIQCWGDNSFNQTGIPSPGGQNVIPSPQAPVQLSSKAVNLSAGGKFNCALLTSGKIECWGRNNYGQLGNATELGGSTPTPVEVQSLAGTPFLIAAGGEFACSVFSDRTAQCWGRNRFGQLGNATNSGTENQNFMPLTVTGLANISQLRTSSRSACALLDTGELQCWGNNEEGQLGNPTNDGTSNDNNTPLSVTGLTTGVLRLFINSQNKTVCAISKA